ncbi:unnamed protein product [Aphanomyces euteiches]
MAVVNGMLRGASGTDTESRSWTARRRHALSKVSKFTVNKKATRRLATIMHRPSMLSAEQSDGPSTNQTVTMTIPVNDTYRNPELLDILMKPVIQVNSIDKPVIALPVTHTFLDDNPIPKQSMDNMRDPDISSLPVLPSLERSNSVEYSSNNLTNNTEDTAKVPPKVSVLNHQKRHQSSVNTSFPKEDRSADTEEIDKKRAEMNLPPLSAGQNDENNEMKLLKKFINRTRVLKAYLNPNVITREIETPIKRRDSLFNVMDNPSSIQNDNNGVDFPTTPPSLSDRSGGDIARFQRTLIGVDDEMLRNQPNIISLESRYKDVHNLKRDGDDQSEHKKNSLNLFQKFCQYIIQKQRAKFVLRHHASVISEIEYSETKTTPDQPRKRAPNSRRQDRESAKMFLSGVDAVLTLDELYDEAIFAEKNRNWRRATMLASACISMEKEWLEPLLLRARLCRRIGLWTQALKDLTAALKICPDSHHLLLQRAHVHTQMQDFHAAIVDLSHVLNQQPNSSDAILLRSKVFAKQGYTSMALKDLTAIIKHDPKYWRAYYERAYLRHKLIEGMGDETKEKTEENSVENLPTLILLAIDDYFDSIRTGCYLKDILETIGDLTIRLVEWTQDAKHCLEVISSFTSIIALMDENEAKLKDQRKLQPEANESYFEAEEDKNAKLLACSLTQRGRLHILIGQHARASSDLDRAVIMDYHYAPAHFYRGAVASITAHDEASRKVVIQHLNRSIHLDPTVTGAYIVRGGVNCGDLRFNNALQDFKAAVTIDPTLDEIWIQIAIVFLTHYHDCEACAKACTRALKNDLGLLQALHLRGEALARQGELKAAIRDYVRLVMMQPTDRFAHLMKGKLLLQLEQARPALYSYVQFMELAHEQSKLDRLTRGKAYKVLSQHSKAVHEFKLAVDADPTPENLCLLSESLHSMGDTEASLHVINQAIDSDPKCAKSYVRRAQCYIANKAYKTAILDYDYAITLAEKKELYRMYYERALCRSQLLNKAWNQLYALQRGERVPCYYENNFRPETPVPITLAQNEMNVPGMTSFIKQTYIETLNDFSKCMKAAETMSDPYIERAALYVLGGEFNSAYKDLAIAIKIDPKSLHAYIAAGVLKCRFSMYAASIDNYDQVRKREKRLQLYNLSYPLGIETPPEQCIGIL